MPGVTKHIYDHDIRDILTMWNRQLKEISLILPQEYTKKDIISLMKKYYPHEWMSVVYKYNYYEFKDRYLKKRFGKKRYNMPKPEKLIESVLQLLLSCAANFSSVKEIEDAYKFFSDELVIYSSNNQDNWMQYSLYQINTNEEVKQSVIRFMQNLGIGLRDIEVTIDQKK